MFVHCLQPVRFVLDQSCIHVSIFPFHAPWMEDDVAPAADEPMADAEDLVGDVPAGPRTLQDMLHGYGNAYWARLPQGGPAACDDLNGMARCVHVVMICLRLYSGGVGGNDAHGVA